MSRMASKTHSTRSTNSKKTNSKQSEEFKIDAEHLSEKITDLINEGTVRKITIKNKSGNTLMSFPLTIGIIGVALAPILAAVGTLAALVSECTISVERD